MATRPRRVGWAFLAFLLALGAMILLKWQTEAESTHILTGGELMRSFLALPALAASITLILLSACAQPHSPALAPATTEILPSPAQPFMAQVVGVQWLNPLQRRDYPTEWQLLWTLGLVKPNRDDDMVRTQPQRFSTLQAVAPIAAGGNGSETFDGYHEKYITELLYNFHDVYFSSSRYFYNAHSLEDKTTWRELAGIHVEYALPDGKLDPVEATNYTRDRITRCFDIGNVHFPNAWTRNTPPDVRVTMGGPNAGFTSLSSALDYLQTHPNETVWVMNWDAPSFPPKDEQINENMVLLVLAGPNYKTERDALAWIGYPSSVASADFAHQEGQPAPIMQAWQATLKAATHNAGKQNLDIGYVIHDANKGHADSSDRIANLAHLLALEVPELDFMQQTFNTPALLGEMGAGSALTNVALGIAYANHFGRNVLIAGTTDPARPTAVLVAPPAKVRPIDPNEPWFRARGENNAYLMWWGIRHDAQPHSQGYSK
ncbi:virulence factor [Pseudoduganella sp. CY13W]|uniref:Virulence factor n=1 Tax=Duganella qianjiadongensis TaxID=2692176 RepID=A0ABW9VNQ8_9BURK|nr:virulence factor [Duganella qianjiadongensis]